jgi:hypothetical protein
VEKKIVNGNVVKDETKTEVIEQVLNGDDKHAISNGFIGDGQEKAALENGNVEQVNMIIIDSTTD